MEVVGAIVAVFFLFILGKFGLRLGCKLTGCVLYAVIGFLLMNILGLFLVLLGEG